MRGTFQRKKSKLLSKRQEIISGLSSSISQQKTIVQDVQKVATKGGLRKALQEVQGYLIDEKQTRQELEVKVRSLQTRGIERQKQFRRIIQQSIPFCNKERSSNILATDLQMLHGQIIDFFDKSQQVVENCMSEEKRWLETHMERRVKEITMHVEEQLQQNNRLKTLNYQAIRRQINTAINLSSSILDENQQLKEEKRRLEFSNSLLKQEKQLLMAQLLDKKNLILKIYKQLHEKYNKNDQIEKEIQKLKKDRRTIEKAYSNYEKKIRQDQPLNFKTISDIKPKAIRVFTTQNQQESLKISINNRKASKYVNSEPSSKEKDFSPSRLFSTISFKQRSYNKQRLDSQAKTMLTSVPKEEDSLVILKLKQSLKNQKRKNIRQAQKIDYLVGYKREIDEFVKHCYKRGELNSITPQKVQNLLEQLRKRIQGQQTSYNKDNLQQIELDQQYKNLLKSN